jgi:ParB-like chromosome segregation protein Spo0J
MKLQNVSLDQIVDNPWRDRELNPIDDEHVAELMASLAEHGFFGGLKGRRVNGKVELGCGHARIEAARKAKMDSIPIYIDDIDDDTMLRLMTDENATQQGGTSAGAVLNEVSAVARRLVEGLLEGQGGTIVPACVAKAFENRHAVEIAQGKLKKRAADLNTELPIGHVTIRTYLGQGNPKNALRGERQIREALAALKQSGRYDEIADEILRKHSPPVTSDIKPAKETKVVKAKAVKPRSRTLDERTASVFENDHQFHAFREAVTTQAAQKAIPVNKQLPLAKEIMREKHSQFSKKQVGAPYIKSKVGERVADYMKAQRKIDKEERDAYLAEQIEEEISAELHTANASLRSLISSLMRLEKLADKYPGHPKLGGFGVRLDDLVNSIKQFNKKLK